MEEVREKSEKGRREGGKLIANDMGEGVKEGKLDNDDSNNSLDPPGGPLPEAPFSLSLSFMLLLSFSPSACLPPIFPPAAVSLLINFSLLTRAQSCSSPQPACETALRSVLPLPHSHSSTSLLVTRLASNQR